MHSKASDQNTDTYDEKGGDKEQKRLQKWQDRLYMIKKSSYIEASLAVQVLFWEVN